MHPGRSYLETRHICIKMSLLKEVALLGVCCKGSLWGPDVDKVTGKELSEGFGVNDVPEKELFLGTWLSGDLM